MVPFMRPCAMISPSHSRLIVPFTNPPSSSATSRLRSEMLVALVAVVVALVVVVVH